MTKADFEAFQAAHGEDCVCIGFDNNRRLYIGKYYNKHCPKALKDLKVETFGETDFLVIPLTTYDYMEHPIEVDQYLALDTVQSLFVSKTKDVNGDTGCPDFRFMS